MKTLKYILPLLIAVFISSCTNNDDVLILDETTELNFIKTFSNAEHTVDVFSTKKTLEQGYNDLYIRIEEKSTSTYIKNASLTWKPVMHMTNKVHSSPRSTITKTEGKETLYNGYIVFQMAENALEKWDLTIDYTIDNVNYTVKEFISVPAAVKKNVTVFTGANDIKYVLALIDPKEPTVGLNDFKIGLYKMESMMSFPVVENFMIKHDPRMPSMGNHSSPNNTDLTFNTASKIYEGELSLTMTGYWKLNLMLYNNLNQLVKGEEVTESNEASSLFLEIEF
ncbi:MAG: hypothetical protein P8K77_09590 [Polaribacter sp.]|nr:hypothetical protein [Polaribacter sp.]